MYDKLTQIIDRLEQRTDPPALTPQTVWDKGLEEKIKNLPWSEDQAADKAVIALMAGLHLRNDSLDLSHTYAQQIEDDATGSYWHAIMHRMEPDYSNSKYWFRRAGEHPVKQTMQDQAVILLKQQTELQSLPSGPIVDKLKFFRDQHSWNSDDFVDLIKLQENGQGMDETRQMLRLLQQLEIRELFHYTYQQAESAI